MVEGRSQELAVSVPPEALWLDADAVRLVQVVENLLNNASKYTDEGGRVEVSAEREGDEAVIAVQDNGIGIEPDLLPDVFDLFTQSAQSLDRSQGGLGIGLTLVKNLVEMHGGSVSASSKGIGMGSRFEVRLPVAQASPQAASKPAEQAAPSEGRRILIVDDNVGAAKMLSLLVAKLGSHEVELAHDGPGAVEAARRFRPDMILLDIGLPRMNGLEVARTLRGSGDFDEVLLLVALTGYGQDEDRRASMAAGFDEHLVKPVGVDALRGLLDHPKLKLTCGAAGR
jgi:CheY-like chemotaxis protein